MSLIVEVYVGNHRNAAHRKLVANMVLHNVSNLADISNYIGFISEGENKGLGIQELKQEIQVHRHKRNQSVWELIKTALEKV